MFQGSAEIKMDAKGRISIPTKYRDQLSSVCDGAIVITASVQAPCLSLYPIGEWQEKVLPQIEALPTINKHAARARRLVIGYAEEFQLESNARVQLSPTHRTFARFEKNLMVVGQGSKLELWDCDAWFNCLDDVGDEPMPDAMQSLSI